MLRSASSSLVLEEPGLYVHVPFCVRKCPYCDFYSIVASAEATELFLRGLALELRSLPTEFRPATLYVGGGTPTSLPAEGLRRLFELIRSHVNLSALREWTCEVNPASITRTHAEVLREYGVSRISLGVQSFDRDVLETLGRVHSSEEALEAFHLLRRCGFTNVGLDLLYGVPEQTHAQLERDLRLVIELRPEHVSYYELTWERSTPFWALREKGQLKAPSARTQLAHFARVRQALTGAGYAHYEISNYALPGRECLHNLLYWRGGQYVGVGPSAHSYWEGARRGNYRDLQTWAAALEAGQKPVEIEEKLSDEKRARELLVFALRCLYGVDREEFQRTTGFDYLTLCGEQIRWLEKLGLLEEVEGRLRLTPQGVPVSNAVFAELI